MCRIWTMMASACSRLLRSQDTRRCGACRPLWPGGCRSSEVLQTVSEIALPPMCASCAGYNLHAGVAIDARDRAGPTDRAVAPGALSAAATPRQDQPVAGCGWKRGVRDEAGLHRRDGGAEVHA